MKDNSAYTVEELDRMLKEAEEKKEAKSKTELFECALAVNEEDKVKYFLTKNTAEDLLEAAAKRGVKEVCFVDFLPADIDFLFSQAPLDDCTLHFLGKEECEYTFVDCNGSVHLVVYF